MLCYSFELSLGQYNTYPILMYPMAWNAVALTFAIAAYHMKYRFPDFGIS